MSLINKSKNIKRIIKIIDEQIDIDKLGDNIELDNIDNVSMQLVEAINRLINHYNSKIINESKNLKLINTVISSGFWYMIMDNSGEIKNVIWSDEFRHLIGYTGLQDFPNKLESWSDLLHPEDKAYTLSSFNACIKDYSGKTPYDLEYRLLTKNNGYKWYHAKGIVLRDSSGKPLQITGIFTDITEERNNRIELESLIQRYKALDTVLIEGALFMQIKNGNPMNPENTVWYSNQIRQLLGYKNETDFPNQLNSWIDVIDEEGKQESLSNFIGYIQDYSNQSPLIVEIKMIHKNGSKKWFKSITNVIYNSDKTPNIVATAIEDITELKKTKEDFQLNIGNHIINLTDSLKGITVSVEEASAKMQHISAEQKNISDDAKKAEQKVNESINIINLIQEIASSTNLLSLNAAIEAAHAGAAGASFSVVAEEVRNLANTSKNTTKKISDSLLDMQNSIKNILSKIMEIDSLVTEQNANMKEINISVDKINTMADKINEITASLIK